MESALRNSLFMSNFILVFAYISVAIAFVGVQRRHNSFQQPWWVKARVVEEICLM